MVAPISDAVTNGVHNNGPTALPDDDVDDQDLKVLRTELGAAANYLQSCISEDGLHDSIVQAEAAGDALNATNKLADAFIKALDSPEDPAASGSLEGCMQELLVWVKKRCAMNDDLVDKIRTGLCEGVSNGELRLRCMALLYNFVGEENHNKRFTLLLATITLASKADLMPKILDTVLPKIDIFLRQWETPVPQKREMYKGCYEALKAADMAALAFAFNVKQLSLYNGATDEELEAAQDSTIDVIVQAVRLPKLYRFDTLLELDAVKRFGDMDGDFKLLHELISIFVRDDLAVFSDFESRNEALLKKHSIDVDVAEDKMRLLTFASLGIDSQDLTYDMIANALRIPEGQVEEWVIRAISSGLVDGKINQLQSSVAIYRSTQRMFTREEWQPLSQRINIWKENIGELLGALRETRKASTMAAAEAYSG
ncbi:Translation initiation factor eIF3 subunit M [Gracilaria domingensis]|nr:Translation initiation factor eIF3 subunit M [Gracilaria domingensis]